MLTLSLNLYILRPFDYWTSIFWGLLMTEQSPITSPNPAAITSAVPLPQDSRMLRSTEIFAGTREVLIAHGDEYYRLRLTRSNKLILHK